MMTDDTKQPPDNHIDHVVDALDRRIVPQGDRAQLRKSLDKADAPPTGRAGADEALGRAIGRTVMQSWETEGFDDGWETGSL